MFPYAQWAPLEGAKQDTIGVTKGTNVKLSHHRGLVLTYQVQNEMPLIHHIIMQWRCSYIVKDDESQDGRTEGHLMPKPKPKLIQAS